MDEKGEKLDIIQLKSFPRMKEGQGITNLKMENTGCPNKHGNAETNSKSSLLIISVVLLNFKGQHKVTSA